MEVPVNCLINWHQEDGSTLCTRVLWLTGDSQGFWMIAIEQSDAQPKWVTSRALASALAEDRASWRGTDPFVPRQLKARPESHYKRRDANWAQIQDLITQEPEIYDPRTRGALIWEVAERLGVRPATRQASFGLRFLLLRMRLGGVVSDDTVGSLWAKLLYKLVEDFIFL